MTAARQDTPMASVPAAGAPDVLQHPHGRAATRPPLDARRPCGCGRSPRRGIARARAVRRRPAGHGARFERRQRPRRDHRHHQRGDRRPARDRRERRRLLPRRRPPARPLQGGRVPQRLRRHDGRARRGVGGEHPRAGPEARRQRRHRNRDGLVRAGDAEHRERQRGGDAHPTRSAEPAAGRPRPVRAGAAHAGGLRPGRAQRHGRFGEDAQPGWPGRIEQLGVRDREPGADQRQRPARRGEQLPARRRDGDEPGLGRRGGGDAEPGIGEGDSRQLEQLLGGVRPQHRRPDPGRVAERHQPVPWQRRVQAQHTRASIPSSSGAARTAKRRSASTSGSARRRRASAARSSATTCSSSFRTRASRATAPAWARSGSRRPSSSPRSRRSARTASRRGRSRCPA